MVEPVIVNFARAQFVASKAQLPANADPPSPYYRHPEYTARWWWWEFNRISYKGGREYARPATLDIRFYYPLPYSTLPSGIPITRDADGKPINPGQSVEGYNALLFRHNREKSWEFENRRQRAHYKNIVKTAVNMLVSHALKQGVKRDTKDEEIKSFWEGVDYQRKIPIAAFMRDGLRKAQIYGLIWCCMDVASARVPAETGETGAAEADASGDGKPYAYWVSPLDIFDWLVDEDGELVWLKQFVYYERERTFREGIRPMHRFRIWTRKDVTEIDIDPMAGSEASAGKTTPHAFGRVPFEPLYSTKEDDCAFPDGEPLVSDLCKAANSIYQYTSLLDELLYKQTFSQLIIPDKTIDTVALGTSTFLAYDSLNGGKAEYISPDPEQVRVMLESIAAELEQARQVFGTGRGRQEAGKDKSSGEALALETEDKRSILADVAAAGADFEGRLLGLIGDLRNVPSDQVDAKITYPIAFDVDAFQVDLADALSLKALGMSPEIMLEIRKQLAARKLAGMEEADRQKLLDTLKAEEPAPAPGMPGAKGAGPPMPGETRAQHLDRLASSVVNPKQPQPVPGGDSANA